MTPIVVSYLVVALSLPGRDRPLLCIPHGAGGPMGADDIERLRHRIERAAERPDAAEQLVHLTWHAHGAISAKVSLVGASVAPANMTQRAVFDALSQADGLAAKAGATYSERADRLLGMRWQLELHDMEERT